VARRYRVSFIEAVRIVAAWGLESENEHQRPRNQQRPAAIHHS
jgi:hypothetical protein